MTATIATAELKPFDLENSTESQQEAMGVLKQYIGKDDRLFIYWMGGVRAGKSFGAAMMFLEHARHRERAEYLVLHYTQNQAVMIYGKYLELIGEAMGYEVKIYRGSANPHARVNPGNHTFLFRGADKAGKDKAIQGMTLDGLLCDELPLLHRDTVHQAEARVSRPGGLRVYTSNKQSPYHWTVKYYIERIRLGLIKGVVLDCNVTGNPHIDQDYVNERKGEYQGNTLTRFMDNKFTLDKPPIYYIRSKKPKKKELTSQQIVSIFAHEFGYELIEGTWCNVDNKAVLWLTKGKSLPPDHVWRPYKGDPIIMMNRGFPRSARVLRGLRHRVKGYRPEYSQPRCELLRMAGEAGAIWADPNQEDLMQAIQTYADPGCYDMPIVIALEALAYQFRHRF